MAKTVPGDGAKIAGQDWCAIGEVDGELEDLDLGAGGLVVQDSNGLASENDPTR